MSHRHHQLDVTRTLATNFLLSHLYTTTVAHDALVADSLILSAVAFVVSHRAENALAEETIALRLVGTVVDGFRLEHFTERIVEYRVGRGQAD